MAIDWEKCISEETVIMRHDGKEELFIKLYEDSVFVKNLKAGTLHCNKIRLYTQSYIIKELPFDFSRFRVAKTILLDDREVKWLFLGRAEDNLFVSKYGHTQDTLQVVYAGKPGTYKNWTVVEYE